MRTYIHAHVAATVMMIPEALGRVRAPHLGFSAGALNLPIDRKTMENIIV